MAGDSMNNITFTGGNWTARRATGEGEIIASLATKNRVICTRLFEIVTNEHVATENQKANAVLMANAPKMCHLIRAWCISDPHGTHSDACRKIIEDIEKGCVE